MELVRLEVLKLRLPRKLLEDELLVVFPNIFLVFIFGILRDMLLFIYIYKGDTYLGYMVGKIYN